jgi:hypothetical protein
MLSFSLRDEENGGGTESSFLDERFFTPTMESAAEGELQVTGMERLVKPSQFSEKEGLFSNLCTFAQWTRILAP